MNWTESKTILDLFANPFDWSVMIHKCLVPIPNNWEIRHIKHDCWNIIRENDYQVGNLQHHICIISTDAHSNTYTHSLTYIFNISYTDFVINYISFNYVKHCIAKNICHHDSHASSGNSRKQKRNLVFLVFHTDY